MLGTGDRAVARTKFLTHRDDLLLGRQTGICQVVKDKKNKARD